MQIKKKPICNMYTIDHKLPYVGTYLDSLHFKENPHSLSSTLCY